MDTKLHSLGLPGTTKRNVVERAGSDDKTNQARKRPKRPLRVGILP